MKKLFLLLALPLASFSSVLYTFSYDTPAGPEGFSYLAPNYFQTSTVNLPGSSFASCFLGGLNPNRFVCDSAYFSESANVLGVQFNYRDAIDPFGGIDGVLESFVGASLTRDGSYQGAINPRSTFSVQTVTANVPEPGTWALLGLGLSGTWFWRRRKA